MHINISDLKNELIIFDDIIKKYENNVINLYYFLEKSFEYWKDAFSLHYYDDLCDEKKGAFEIIENIKFLRSIYNNLEENYSKFGNKIDFNSDKIDGFIEVFDNFIGNISQLSDNYNNLSLSFIPDEYYDIIDQKNSTISLKEKISNVKDKYISNFNKIDSIEKNVFLKLSKYDVNIIKNKPDDFINASKENGNISSVYIGKEDLKRIVESSIMYVEEQELLVSSFKEIYENIRSCYISDNCKILNVLWVQVIDNMDSVIKYYINFIDVLSYVISLYDVTVEDYYKAFRTIGNSSLIASKDILGKGDFND